MHSKVQIMGYLAMYKSQNWYFWRKLLFFDPGGALKSLLVLLLSHDVQSARWTHERGKNEKDKRLRARFEGTFQFSFMWTMRKVNESLWLKHLTNVREHWFVFVDALICRSLLDMPTEVCFFLSTNIDRFIHLLGIRYCFLCRFIKPDRTHYCSICGKCVLRYNHQCSW